MVATVYLMRHGDAYSVGEMGIQTDEERTLTPQGIEKLEQQARGFHNLGEIIDACYASPYLRAYETAQIMASRFGLEEEIVKTPVLAGEASWEGILYLLSECNDENILLVGHSPFMGQLLSKFISGHIYSATAFSKGAICRIDLIDLEQQPTGHLRWFLNTKQLQFVANC